ncbi:MAG: hypothetical protein ABI651_01795 [Verrucomicrobiota bacterium]
MDSQQAKKVLTLFRPGYADEAKPEFEEALKQTKRDPELATWFNQHCAFQKATREQFRQIVVPGDLKDRILSQTRPRNIVLWRRPSLALAAAAAIVLLGALAAFWFRPGGSDNLTAYRNRMVRSAMREYRMNLLTNDLNEIRRFLKENQAHGDYVLPKPLEKLPGTGCAILSWQGKRVSLVCFELDPRNDLLLFITDRKTVSNAPPAGKPQFAPVGKLMTASWTAADKVYVLAGLGDQKSLQQYLK